MTAARLGCLVLAAVWLWLPGAGAAWAQGTTSPAPPIVPVVPAAPPFAPVLPAVQTPLTAPVTSPPPPAAPLSAAPPPAAPPLETWLPRSAVTLEGLDKVTARRTALTGKVGDTLHFGSLSIVVRGCVVRPPDQPADAAAFLAITDAHAGEPGFAGWMFAAEPAVAMLAHPLYDVRVTGCQ